MAKATARQPFVSRACCDVLKSVYGIQEHGAAKVAKKLEAPVVRQQ